MAIPKNIEPVTISPGRRKARSAGVRRRIPRPIYPTESITSCPKCGAAAVERVTPYSRTVGCVINRDHFDQVFSKNAQTYFENYDPNGGPTARAMTDRYRNRLYVR